MNELELINIVAEALRRMEWSDFDPAEPPNVYDDAVQIATVAVKALSTARK